MGRAELLVGLLLFWTAVVARGQNYTGSGKCGGTGMRSIVSPCVGETDFYFGTRVRCHTCDVDFTIEKFSVEHPCLVAQKERDIAYCSVNSNFCKVEVTRLNGVLVTFSRRCVDKCSPNCFEKGFGMLREQCTYCCRRNPSCGEKRKP